MSQSLYSLDSDHETHDSQALTPTSHKEDLIPVEIPWPFFFPSRDVSIHDAEGSGLEEVDRWNHLLPLLCGNHGPMRVACHFSKARGFKNTKSTWRYTKIHVLFQICYIVMICLMDKNTFKNQTKIQRTSKNNFFLRPLHWPHQKKTRHQEAPKSPGWMFLWSWLQQVQKHV